MKIIQFLILSMLVVACNSNPNSSEKSENQDSEQSIDKGQILNSQIEGKKWLLIELVGMQYEVSDNDTAYFTLDSEKQSIYGRLGCNNFFGNYKIEENQKISFSELGTTMMACPDMTTENQMQDILPEVDNFTVKDGVLSLKWGKDKTLASFKLEKTN